MTHLTQTKLRRHGGFVSIMIAMFLIIAILFILARSLQISGTTSLDTRLDTDRVSALLMAESGLERGMGLVSSNINFDDTVFVSSCASLASSSAFALAGGTFQYLTPSAGPTSALCTFRVKGSFGLSQRTLEQAISIWSQIGTADTDGTNVSLTLKNTSGVPAVAVFNLAFRRHETSGAGQATATACSGCGLEYALESSSGLPSVGSLGSALAVAANATVTVTQTINTPRDYAEVGMIMPGLGSAPAIKGSYGNGSDTANNANNTVTTGVTSSGEASNWCRDADTLVFGISGRSNNDVTAGFASVVFNTSGSPAQPIPLTWIAHYPNTDGSTPNALGDVFSEIWWTYNPTFPKVVANSTGTSAITLSTPTTVKLGTLVKVYSGSGTLAGNTTITGITDSTHITVSATPTLKLTNATLCGGICALFDNPSSNSTNTVFTVTRSNAAAQQWAGGFTCLSGVDPALVRRISHSGIKRQTWHEVIQ
jgi:hypothetical protein